MAARTIRLHVYLYDVDGNKTGVHVFTCKDAKAAVSTLKQEILVSIFPAPKKRFQLELAGSGKVLREEETVEKVLHDGDSVYLRK